MPDSRRDRRNEQESRVVVDVEEIRRERRIGLAGIDDVDGHVRLDQRWIGAGIGSRQREEVKVSDGAGELNISVMTW